MTSNKNICYTYGPKMKDPYTGKWETNYFVPALQNKKGKKTNYIVITCSPKFNGVWEWDAANLSNYDTWANGRMICLYVPICDCRKIKELAEVTNEEYKAEIIKQQKQWYNKQVKNQNYEYKNKPDWMLW